MFDVPHVTLLEGGGGRFSLIVEEQVIDCMTSILIAQNHNHICIVPHQDSVCHSADCTAVWTINTSPSPCTYDVPGSLWTEGIRLTSWWSFACWFCWLRRHPSFELVSSRLWDQLISECEQHPLSMEHHSHQIQLLHSHTFGRHIHSKSVIPPGILGTHYTMVCDVARSIIKNILHFCWRVGHIRVYFWPDNLSQKCLLWIPKNNAAG